MSGPDRHAILDPDRQRHVLYEPDGPIVQDDEFLSVVDDDRQSGFHQLTVNEEDGLRSTTPTVKSNGAGTNGLTPPIPATPSTTVALGS